MPRRFSERTMAECCSIIHNVMTDAQLDNFFTKFGLQQIYRRLPTGAAKLKRIQEVVAYLSRPGAMKDTDGLWDRLVLEIIEITCYPFSMGVFIMVFTKERVDTKGRVSIKKILNKTNIKPGDLVEVVPYANKIVVRITKKEKPKGVFARMAGTWANRSDIEIEEMLEQSKISRISKML